MKSKISEKEIRSTKNEYFRKWRENNKDKVKEYNRRYWEKKTQERLQNKEKESKNG